MDEPAQGVRRHHAQKPHDEKDYKNGPKHRFPPENLTARWGPEWGDRNTGGTKGTNHVRFVPLVYLAVNGLFGR
jgi:hypothetical protein